MAQENNVRPGRMIKLNEQRHWWAILFDNSVDLCNGVVYFGVNFVDGRNKNGTWDRELAIKLVHSRRLVDLLVASLFVIESRRISAYLLFTAAKSQRCVVKKSKGKSYVAFIWHGKPWAC